MFFVWWAWGKYTIGMKYTMDFAMGPPHIEHTVKWTGIYKYTSTDNNHKGASLTGWPPSYPVRSLTGDFGVSHPHTSFSCLLSTSARINTATTKFYFIINPTFSPTPIPWHHQSLILL